MKEKQRNFKPLKSKTKLMRKKEFKKSKENKRRKD